MTTRPRFRKPKTMVPGVIAVALFGLLSAIFLTAGFGAPEGFETAGITASIGYAMFNLDAGVVDSEGFLVAFILIALVLDAALDGSLMLAKREGEDER